MHQEHNVQLSHTHWEHLTVGSAIAPDIVQERPYFTVESKHQWQQLDQKLGEKQIRTPGIGYPAYRVARSDPYVYILRPDNPRIVSHKPVKYEWPKGIPPCLDILPRFADALPDPSIDVWFTEGAKKADALASAFRNKIVPINLNGVWGIRGATSAGGKATLIDFRDIAWNGRRVVIAYDSDVIRNPKVEQAATELASLLQARGAAEVSILVLPQLEDEKLGVDDALAQGKTVDWLQAHILPLSELRGMVRQKIGAHPETGKAIFLPAGYLNTGEQIARVDRQGDPHIVYPGMLAVNASGVDLQSNIETLSVKFEGREQQTIEVTAPRSDLSRAKGVIEHLAAKGAAVHESNARDVARYLSEFAYENRDALPHRVHVDRLGICEPGLILPAGTVGFDRDVRYIGKHTIRVGTDLEVYKRTIAEACTWENAWTFWTILAFSLASPAIARIRPRRNPGVYLGGMSNSGKTTLAQFAIGSWGDPTRAPLRIEAARTTRAGILQTLEHLHGLPLFIDEAHTTRDPRDLEATCYQFANGEAYTRGGVDGKTRGGESLGGSLILAGEALLEFKHAGAANRVLWIDVDEFFALGEPVGSSVGAERAALLEQAWLSGAGILGLHLAYVLWNNWADFLSDVQRLQKRVAPRTLGPWADAFAIAAATLATLFRMLPLDAPSHLHALFDRWEDMLVTGKSKIDPATDAWEHLTAMLAQAEESEESVWTVAKLQYQIVACRRKDEQVWRVLTNTPQFKERVGPSAVQLYGRTWLQRGLILPHDKGETSQVKAIPGHKTQRVLLVPVSQLEDHEGKV